MSRNGFPKESQIRSDGWQSESEVLWGVQEYINVQSKIEILFDVLNDFLRSGFGPQGDDESRSQGSEV